MSNIKSLSDSLTAAVETASASTLLVDARRRFPASGIAYAADLILTADHVVKRESEIRVGLPDGKSLSANLVGRDPGSDLALLRLSEKVLTPAKTAKSPKVGQLVLALGRPSMAGMKASFGIITTISGPTRTWRGGLLDQFLQTETVPYPGFSGGPLVNVSGEVLGLNTSGLTRGEALTIPVSVAWLIAESLAKHGTVKRGYLGVRTQAVETGLLVMWLEKDGPAEKGGLLIGDILTRLNDQELNDPDDLFAALANDTVGKAIEVDILRGGQPQKLKLTVGERK
ncbi:MAG: trypsin-like peptidase domain-containing protein [Anaerolineales bacterium]|uniref:Trypsin-like peptidase domain-containing protein n=1 Tax=Candidatus Desulfolinea nitratireducens TaxID=2841698 RepID=A0A8J6NKI5_9CHLR|nr:trypsin-like peptidase domain-containing protein [Candidatus Desulfolinea nitratireducens]